MKITQLSVFLENTAGRLCEVTGILRDAQINIRALSLAETADFGVLRVIVNDLHRAMQVLKENHFTVCETPILAVEVPDRPGGLHGLVKALAKRKINIEYVYGFVEKRTENAVIVVRVEDLDAAIGILQSQGFNLLSDKEISAL